jgi:hypothetical protein
MVRASATEVLKLFGAAYPPGWDATRVGNICTMVDAELDAMTYPDTLSLTDTKVIQLCNLLTYRRILHSIWARAGGSASGTPEPVVWSTDLVEMLSRLKSETYSWFKTVDMISDED